MVAAGIGDNVDMNRTISTDAPASTTADTAAQRFTARGWQAAQGAGWQVAGIANLHSHAFQRAMAGMSERRGRDDDSFWTWRELMYALAARFDPERLHAVAAQVYAEMLEAGYTTVCEFHYLHHAPDGRPYATPTAMSDALIHAAREVGIRLTLLPVLYVSGGFDGRALSARQRRFGNDVAGYLRLFEHLWRQQDDGLRVGCALHSLRAVPEAAMREVLAALPPLAPLHIHVAEQLAEVQECLALRRARPVEWLLDHAPVDARWTLVHATHLEPAEIRALAGSGATVAVCPTTEANLGDGLFPLRDFLAAGGRIGIGSDSHVSVSAVEELRWLEYGQRLCTHKRNVAAAGPGGSVGERLLGACLASADDASGFADAGDWVQLDLHQPQFAATTRASLLDRWLFAGNRPAVESVTVQRRRCVEAGRHISADAIGARFTRSMRGLLEGL